MSKVIQSKKTEEQRVPIVTTAIQMRKIDSLLAQAFELTLIDGVVVEEKALNVPNLPTYAIGSANKNLWNQFRGRQK